MSGVMDTMPHVRPPRLISILSSLLPILFPYTATPASFSTRSA